MTTVNVLTKLSMATAGAAFLALGTVASAQAATIVTGSITKPTPETTTVDYWNFAVNTAGIVTIDVLANDIDFGNGSSSLDSQIYLFSNDGLLDTSDLIAGNDDSLISVGGSDGSVSTLDSFLSQFLNPGNYTLAISDFSFSLSEAINGIQTDGNFLGNNLGDYQITFTGDVDLASVPEPASLMGILGLGAFGVTSLRKRKAAVKA